MEKNKLLDGILGLAVGDALGVPVEFRNRQELKANPVTDMRGYGSHYQPVGTWSDDTSMTLATVDSLKNGIDLADMMQRFDNWYREAHYTAGGSVFDVGIATSRALSRFHQGIAPTQCGGSQEYDNGNGSLMRILPAAVYCYEKMPEAAIAEKLAFIDDVSSLTHAHRRSQISCEIYAFLVWAILDHPAKDAIHIGLEQAKAWYTVSPNTETAAYSRLFDPDYAALPEDAISSSGYVVSTLEAAVWCLLNTNTYKDCVLKAVNLGNDTDTVGAVAGGLAGLIYGLDAIPNSWLDGLKNREYILALCRE